MSCSQYRPVFPRVAFQIRNRSTFRLLATTLAMGGASLLGTGALWAGSTSVLVPARDELTPPAGIAWAGSGLEAQIVVENPPVKINLEAFNKRREKDIAEDSRKLLTLAIELKSEVNTDPDFAASPNAVKKAKEIEKLAHRVKETMSLNMAGPN